ncbi:MAG: hypothetical protein WD898_01615 [Candidatus Paceibacterota bacterium]
MLKERIQSAVEIAAEQQDHVAELFTDLGLDLKKINPNILRKLRLLNEKTDTLKDEERSIHVARSMFKYYEDNIAEGKFSEEEKRTVLIGTFFTDIGKTGPKDATPDQERLVLGVYDVENIGDPTKISLAELINKSFPDDAEERLSKAKEMGLDGNMTMREFYNIHARWTLEIISGDGVPPEAVVAAATHHIIEGVNPGHIVGEDGRFTKYFGDNASFDRAEKLIILLDKYDAFRRRGGKNHAEAIQLFRAKVRSNPQFAGDKQFEELITNLDDMISGNAKIYEKE